MHPDTVTLVDAAAAPTMRRSLALFRHRKVVTLPGMREGPARAGIELHDQAGPDVFRSWQLPGRPLVIGRVGAV